MEAHLPVDAASQPKQLQGESSNHQSLSKKAQKRATRAARFHELKLERRARDKEAKRHKRRERALAIANGELSGDNLRKRRGVGETEIFNAKVVVDLGFDELMSDKEISSLTSQLAYTYSANRHAAHAFPVLIFTSLNGRTKQRLDAMNDASYRRWSGTEWWEEGYDRLWAEPGRRPQSPTAKTNIQSSLPPPAQDDRKNIIYLTADSSEELLELNEGEIYVIGGICDHNRYKNLCLNKAINSQIRHARLPIGRYISLATRKVLTVNQVFQILLKWIDTHNWEESFWAVIPKRKFHGGQRDHSRGGDEMMKQDDDNGHGQCTDEEEVAHARVEGDDIWGEGRGSDLAGGEMKGSEYR